jgi:hypothetical protein
VHDALQELTAGQSEPQLSGEHPNPYIAVFERLASSPNARTITSLGIWPEVMTSWATSPARLSAGSRNRPMHCATRKFVLQEKYDRYRELQTARDKN